jgi:hypothetical protein
MPDREMTDAELDLPATKRDVLDLHRELTSTGDELRADFSEQLTSLRADISGQLGSMRAEFDGKLASTRDALRTHFEEQLASTRDELRRHFDVVAERFHSDFANLFDWTQSTTSTTGPRVDDLETRVTRLEQRRKD